MALRHDPHASDRGLVRRILEEHRGLLRRLGALEACFGEVRAGRDEPALAKLAGALDALRGTLAAHFEMEERSDIFSRIERERPELVERAAALRAEHAAILEKLDEARARCSAENGEAAATAAALVRLIRIHEAEEDDLLIETFWHDLGAAD